MDRTSLLVEHARIVDGEAGGRVEIGTASGSGWTKSGPGTVAVAEFANYEGGVTVSGGVLELASQAVFQGTVTTSSSGTLCLLSGVGLDLSKVAGTKRVSAGGTIDADPLTVSSGVFTVLSGASIQATTVKVTGGTLSVVDGAPYAEVEKLTLSGGTISFKETTTLPCPIDLTGSATVTAASPSADAEPVVGTLSGAVSAANATNKAKLSVTGSNGGIVQMAGGASFPKSNTELFVSSSGILEIVSNVVSFASYAGLEGEGKKILVKDGGTLRQTSGYLFIGSSSSTTSVVEVAAGGLLANASGGGVYLGVNGAFGRLVVSGGEVSLSGAGTFQCGYTTVPSGTPGKGEIVLSGGVLKAGRSLGIYSSSALAFDGGTLEFSGTYTSWFYGNFTMAVSVGANGGLLKTDGHDVGFRPCTIAGSGRLTVSGGGTVTFAGESPDWTGGILADGANLKAVNGLSFGTGSIGLASGASVDLGGNTVTAAGLFGAGTVKNGTLIASGPLTMTVGDMIVFNAATLDVTDSSLVATNPEDFGNRRWFAVRTSNGGAVTGATSLSHNLPQKNARVDVTAAGIVADPCLGLLLLVR